MKKVLSLILALAMVFALVACGEKQPASDGDASGDGDKSARGNVIMTFGTADTGGSMYPAGTYSGQDNDANTFGVKCLIIVTADMDADLVYDLCKAMNEHTEELAAGNALLKDMTDPSFLCTQMPIPLHDGAQKYYSEQGLI